MYHEFSNTVAYAKALDKNPELALIPIDMASKLCHLSESTVWEYIRTDKLDGIIIGEGNYFVCAKGAYEHHKIYIDRKNDIKNILRETAQARQLIVPSQETQSFRAGRNAPY